MEKFARGSAQFLEEVQGVRYIHVTVLRNRFHFKLPTRRSNYPNLFCYKTLHVSGILSAHHQVFSTVHLALISFM